MKVKNLIGKKYDTLTKNEQKFYDDIREKYQLNTCDKTNVICYAEDLVWDVFGFDALSVDVFEEMEAQK